MVAVSFKLNKKIIMPLILAAVMILAAMVSAGAASKNKEKARVKAGSYADVENYLSSFGIVTDGAAKEDEITVPTEFGNVYKEYNDIQKSQGFDLLDYRGKTLKRLTYKVKSEESGGVFAEVLLFDGGIVGADVYSTSVTGFMKALK